MGYLELGWPVLLNGTHLNFVIRRDRLKTLRACQECRHTWFLAIWFSPCAIRIGRRGMKYGTENPTGSWNASPLFLLLTIKSIAIPSATKSRKERNIRPQQLKNILISQRTNKTEVVEHLCLSNHVIFQVAYRIRIVAVVRSTSAASVHASCGS